MKSILVFIVAYNAAAHIERLLKRIPGHFWQRDLGNEVLLIDDASTDETVLRAHDWAQTRNLPLILFRNPINQGYGGNQKLGYSYAIAQGFDAVVLLHGDGQYAPELLDAMAAPIIAGKADVVLGSRMLKLEDALKGKMPLYKLAGNRIITTLQNRLLHTSLSEFHTGYRAWSIDALKRLPFLYNSPDFDFDTEILIQCVDLDLRIKEIPIPTHYGDEVCHVNGLKYAWQVLCATVVSRLQDFGIFYTPKYDYLIHGDNSHYAPKLGLDSSHTYGVAACKPGDKILDLGCGNGLLVETLNAKNVKVFGIDRRIPNECKSGFAMTLEKDLESLVPEDLFSGHIFDVLLMLDVIEHLNNPEAFLVMLRERFGVEQPKLVITTPNIAFIIMRLSLLLGQFNYGKSGILDFTHRRLFTFRTLKHMLQSHGYIVERMGGIPVPFELLLGNTRLARLLTRVNEVLIAISKSLFSFQIFVEAYPMPTERHLLEISATAGQSLWDRKT